MNKNIDEVSASQFSHSFKVNTKAVIAQ